MAETLPRQSVKPSRPPEEILGSDDGTAIKNSRQHHVPTQAAPETGKTLTIIAVVLAVLLVGGFSYVHHRRAAADDALEKEKADTAAPPVVHVVPAKYTASSEPFTMPGGTAGWYESTIYARVNGYVATWTGDIGDHVIAGQVLATIETPDLDARLSAAKAKLAAAQSDVNVAKASVALAKTTYERWWNSPEGVVSQQEREEKKAELDTSVAKLAAAQAQVKINEADVKNLEVFTEYKNVTAPFDGVITARKIDIGDLVSAGSTTGTTFLYSIAQSDRLRVFIDVPQTASAGLKVGMAAYIEAAEYPDRKFAGKVARTANAIDPNSRTLHVEVDIDNKDFLLVPGMYVQVSFELVYKPLVRVPAAALLFRAAGTQVAVVGDDGKVHFQKVAIANDQGDFVEIGSGLAENAKVALNLSSQITDGEKVTPRQAGEANPASASGVAEASVNANK